MSIAKHLGQTLGGSWTYAPFHGWYCDDGQRRIALVCAGIDEWGEAMGPTQYWLYGDGLPRRAEAYLGRVTALCPGGFVL